MSGLKVLMLSLDLPPRAIGGIGRHVQDLFDDLDEHGLEVTLVVPRKDGYAMPTAHSGSRIVEVPYSPILMPATSQAGYAIWELISVFDANIWLAAALGRLSQEQYDILHFHDIFSASPGIALADLTKIPLIITKHYVPSIATESALEDDVQIFSQQFLIKVVQTLEKRMLQRASGIIGVSRDSIDYMRKLVDIPPHLLRWIPNGTDFHKYANRRVQAQEKRSSICKSNEKLILLPGILELRKGGHILLEAIHILGRNELKVTFLGEGPAADKLHQLAHDLNLESQVHFLGHVEDPEVADWYLAADLVVLPSFREALPYALLEAMALGTPVIASTAGGVAELITHGVTGLLTPIGDAHALADAIRLVVDNPDYAKTLSRNAEAQVRERWSRRAMAQQTIDFYNYVLSQ